MVSDFWAAPILRPVTGLSLTTTPFSAGACSVIFYNWDVDWSNPLYAMSFTHVVTRDFNGDGIVNFEDFAVLGSNWHRTDCSEPDNCSGTDLDADGHVGISDLMQFAEYWLEKTR